jgi:hypothetical protein
LPGPFLKTPDSLNSCCACRERCCVGRNSW